MFPLKIQSSRSWIRIEPLLVAHYCIYMRGNRLNLYWTNDNGEYNSWFASLIVRITLSWKWNGSLWFLTQFRDFITPWFWKLALLIECNIIKNEHKLSNVFCCESKIWMDMWNSGWDINRYIEAAWVSQKRNDKLWKKSQEDVNSTERFDSVSISTLCEIENDIQTGYQSKYP